MTRRTSAPTLSPTRKSAGNTPESLSMGLRRAKTQGGLADHAPAPITLQPPVIDEIPAAEEKLSQVSSPSSENAPPLPASPPPGDTPTLSTRDGLKQLELREDGAGSHHVASDIPSTPTSQTSSHLDIEYVDIARVTGLGISISGGSDHKEGPSNIYIDDINDGGDVAKVRLMVTGSIYLHVAMMLYVDSGEWCTLSKMLW